MTLIWDKYPDRDSLILALALADFARDDGTGIWPSVALMASKTMYDERTVQRWLAAMRESGWLVPVGTTKGGKGKTTMYRIPVELVPQGVDGRVTKLHPLPKVPQDRVDTYVDKSGETVTLPRERVTSTTLKGDRMPPDTLVNINESLNPGSQRPVDKGEKGYAKFRKAAIEQGIIDGASLENDA